MSLRCVSCFFVSVLRTQRHTRTDTLVPITTLFRSPTDRVRHRTGRVPRPPAVQGRLCGAHRHRCVCQRDGYIDSGAGQARVADRRSRNLARCSFKRGAAADSILHHFFLSLLVYHPSSASSLSGFYLCSLWYIPPVLLFLCSVFLLFFLFCTLLFSILLFPSLF